MADGRDGGRLRAQWLRWDVATSVIALVVFLWLAFAWTELFEALAGLLGAAAGVIVAAHGAGRAARQGGVKGWTLAGILGVLAVLVALLGVVFLGDLVAVFRTP